MNFPVIVLGAGGHAKVLIDILRLRNISILGVVCPKSNDEYGLNIPWLGEDEILVNYLNQSIRLVNGIGSVKATLKRREIFEKYKKLGFNFSSVIHPSAVIAADVKLGEGVQIMAGAVLQTGSQIGENTIINTKVSVDHDCIIGAHVHLSPGVTLSGNVYIGNGTHVGTGANIIQGIKIGEGSLVGAGGLVIRDVKSKVTVFGVPAKEILK
ncbi:MAG: acetyltransferase [Bacteroidota bacterium]